MTLYNWAQPGAGVVITCISTGGGSPGNIIDNNDTSWWMQATSGNGGWIKIDLGAKYTISQFRLNQQPNNSQSAALYEIAYSDDGASWNILENHARAAYDETYSCTPTAAQWWRLTSLNGLSSNWAVRTWEIWGEVYSPPTELSCASTTEEVIQHVWDNYYQDTFTAIETLFPEWLYEEMDAWHIAFLVFQAKKIICCCESMSAQLGNLTFDDTDILNAISDLDAVVDSGITAIATNDNANAADIEENDNTNTSALIALINQRAGEIEANDNGNTSGLIGTINAARDNVNTNVDTESSQIQSHMDVHETSAAGDRAAKYAATLAALTSGLAQQTTDLAGPLGTTHDDLATAIAGVQADTDDIQESLSTLPSMSGALRLWPGEDGVTYQPSVLVTAPTELNVACHGVLVTVNGFPPGQSRQPAGATTRYKGLGWLAFRSVERDYDQLESIQFAEQVIITKQLLQADGLAVYCKPGASITIRPFLINDL